MKTMEPSRGSHHKLFPSPTFGFVRAGLLILLSALALARADAQVLLNIDFGGSPGSPKTGPAAAGILTNDVWNIYRHYDPKFMPGMQLVADGRMEKLRLHDGTETRISVAVANAPGVWGNASGDPMFDTYMYSQNGSNITVTLKGLPAGRYHFYLYGHADADVSPEQNSAFTLRSGTNTMGPLSAGGGPWRAGQPWAERAQVVVMRDVLLDRGEAVIEVAAGAGGIPVLNGLQVLSRGTGSPRVFAAGQGYYAPANTNLLFRQITYKGAVSDTAARFDVRLTAESMTTNEISAVLFEGDVAIVAPQLPSGLHIVSEGRTARLVCSTPGIHEITMQVLARITRAEPWNTIAFHGPDAAIASILAEADNAGVELEMRSGTQVAADKGAGGTNARSEVSGFLGADRAVALRWQSKGAEVSRKSLLTVDTTATAEVTPTVVKFQTGFRYEILQAAVPKLKIAVPAGHALTRIQGDQIRDWQVTTGADGQELTIEFIRPVEKSCSVTLFSEQTLSTAAGRLTLEVPKPLEVQREAGSLTLKADDTTLEVESSSGLRQVNAAAGSIAAYRYNSRPISVEARVRRIEPALKAVDRITARLEETRLLISHALALTVEKAGIYSIEMIPQQGFTVSDVTGDGIEEWKSIDGKLSIAFDARVLGQRKLNVLLEKANRDFPDRIEVLPLQVAGVTNFATQLGAASSPGIRLKTDSLSNLREIPVNTLPERGDELLAFASEQPTWRLSLASEKLPPRIVSEVFNLVTIGDGLVGGSATIRYGIINQGVREFRLSVPAHWKNIEFTGPMIRRKEQTSNTWTITLQDKAWGAYTLVVTYDYQFDPKGATLDLSGAHTLGVERETGSLGIMTAATLKLTPGSPKDPLRRVDEAELSESDRALCTRPLLLAYKYTGTDFAHSVQVTRFEELAVLDAVADRTELATVLTEDGQLLTQSSFMVKNNQKQFQKFKLPKTAELWSTYVNGQPAKPEKDGDWYLVPLPREANRDQAFAVEIVYAEKVDLKKSLFPRKVELVAPITDIPNTYAEWQLFAPQTRHLMSFAGNMTVASGTIYGFHSAWQLFMGFYGNLIDNHLGAIIGWAVVALIVALVIVAIRRGVKGAVTVVVLFGIFAILAAMLLPALSKAKSRSQRVSSINNLKQIGLAAKTWALDNGDVFPPSFEAMMNELSTDKITYDPKTGQRYIYVGAGKSEQHPEAIVAYSPSDANGREVLFADGSVQQLTREKFDMAMQRDAALPRAVISQNIPAPATPGRPDATLADSGIESARSEIVAGLPATLPPGDAIAAEAPPQRTFTAGGFGGGGGGGGFAAIPQQLQPGRATATGVRPIRIDIPRAGQAFSFTKVLNTGREPLTIKTSIVRLGVYRSFHMVAQITLFVVGLIAFTLMWISGPSARPARRAFFMTLSIALVLYSVTSLLLIHHRLHIGFIIAVPTIVLSLLTWGVARLWKRYQAAAAKRKEEMLHGFPPTTPPAETGPALPLILVGLMTLTMTGRAQPAATEQGTAVQPASKVSIVSAQYSGTAGEKVGVFTGKIAVSTTGTNQTIPFFGPEVAVESFKATANARLIRSDKGLSLLVPDRGQSAIDIKFVVKTTGDVTRRALGFDLPSALASQVDLTIEESDADVEFPSAVAFERITQAQRTQVKAVLGAANRFEMSWTPRVKRAAEVSATVFVQNSALVSVGGGVVNTRAALQYQVSQGELKQLQIRVPADHRVLRVEGEFLRIWEVSGDMLTIELLKSVSPEYKLTIETEKPLERLPVSLRIETPHAVGVKRETGMVAFRGGEEVALSPESVSDLQRVDAEEFHRSMPGQKDAVSAYRFLTPEFVLLLRADAVQPQIEAVLKQRVRLGSESARLLTQVDYSIKRAGIFKLRASLPPGYRVESVHGQNIAQWVERTEASTRYLEVTLKERTMGAYSLSCVLVQNYKEAPALFKVAGVHPIGVEKLTGYISVAGEPGLAVKTSSFDGLTEIPSATALQPSPPPGQDPANQPAPSSKPASEESASLLAFKFSSADASPAWSLQVSTEPVEPWVRAEVCNTITLSETLVSGRTLIKYEVVNAPTREFRLKVPAEFKNVEITGAQIRRRDQTNDTWRVELQSKVRGDYILTVTWELPKESEKTALKLSGIHALGVERETGYIGIVARPPLQATEQSTTELLARIDVRELPAWAGQADSATVLAYRYLRTGYALNIEAKRFAEAAVLQALIDSARLTTVVADDGQIITEASLSIRNNGRQHLEIQLPQGHTVWSAFVAGDPVRPNKRDGKLLLPLTRDTASDAPIAVELTYVGASEFPKYSGKISLVTPAFDIPMKNARWELYMPPDYEYSRFDGSMSKTSETTAAPLVQVYSLSEYNEQQRIQEQQQKMEVDTDLKAARKGLSGGNLREAVETLNRAKFKGQALEKDGANQEELKQVEKEVRRAQSSNIIAAQNQYYFDNAGKLGDELAGRQLYGVTIQNGSAGAWDYAEVAGLQWEKLEKAQQVATVKVAPLRVNLPTRGVHFSFAQVLQTEVGKPMVVEMVADNTKAPSWLQRIVVSVAAFAVLWGVIAIVNARRDRVA